MKKFEKISKENLIDELMLDTIKGGCCKWTERETAWPNSTDWIRDDPETQTLIGG